MNIQRTIAQLEDLLEERRDTAEAGDEYAQADVPALEDAISILTERLPDNAPTAMASDDRQLFVRNLGWLLRQTRCGVIACELYTNQDRELVIALYDHGWKCEIDVTADSHLAIIKDVVNRV